MNPLIASGVYEACAASSAFRFLISSSPVAFALSVFCKNAAVFGLVRCSSSGVFSFKAANCFAFLGRTVLGTPKSSENLLFSTSASGVVKLASNNELDSFPVSEGNLGVVSVGAGVS